MHIPWQGWSLTTEDFVVTRCMEMVVHGDDLAASIDVPTPGVPDPVVERVFAASRPGVAVRRARPRIIRALGGAAGLRALLFAF